MLSVHPGRVYVAVRQTALRVVRRITLAGRDVYCPVCDTYASRFLTPTPHDRVCYACGSRGRQRLLWHYLAARIRPDDPLLHIAAEPCVTRALARAGADAWSLDLHSPFADVRGDLTDERAICAAAGCGRWRWVLCSHVLEHIPDDRAAMRTLRALLAPDGVLIVQVPADPTRDTYEDWTITTRAERRRAFGQDDHVRIYGRDLSDRLRAAGLRVETVWASHIGAGTNFALDMRDPLFVATPEQPRE
jgi:SAM-dependent methyltransferase